MKNGIIMKTHIFILILLSIIFYSCSKNKPQPFNKELLDAVLEAKDTLKNSDNNLLSIEFYNQDRYDRGCMMKVFTSNCYASGYIDAFTKIGNTTVAIYNIKDDIYETINKNEITFFIDTIKGYKDTCVLFQTNKKVFYSIYKSDSSIVKTTYPFDDFPVFQPLRVPKCKIGATYTVTVPKSEWFRLDSIQAEKEVEYYRTKGKKLNNSSSK